MGKLTLKCGGRALNTFIHSMFENSEERLRNKKKAAVMFYIFFTQVQCKYFYIFCVLKEKDQETMT